ncbi:MAG: RagB/SusD family nutrient uptake outer membrane protein [Bacteroidales bacterium]|nr:RagB/SusD family nutrient uptake outer membrane protein [Bacteroidales bacterium]
MKFKSIIILSSLLLVLSCTDLDLSPLSEGSSENWYSNETEIEMAVNDLFRHAFWPIYNDEWTDDYTRRELTTPITNATINGEWGTVSSIWQNSYKAISRANTVIKNLEEVEGIPQAILDKFVGNAHFNRAAQYAKLVFLYGDVIYYTNVIDIEEAFTMSRTNKAQVLQSIYEDYDLAASKLPVSYGNSENKLATKGAALAMKARIALQMGDWAIARDAAKACIDLGTYELYPDFEELFLTRTKNPKELIFGLPRSREFNVVRGVRDFLPRNAGGWGGAQAPSWELLSAFLCTDGLPIDESPLYNPQKPFENRDPRCTATIVEFQTPHLGYIYQPHPDSTQVLNLNTGNYQKNNDTRSNAQFASFNGLLWKKGIDEEWRINYQAENDIMIMRYADVLLMYAEAKIELGEIDQSVRDAINRVRARAYKVNFDSPGAYPAVTATSHSELRSIVRMERRMEFAFEGRRYEDIIRWRIAEEVLNNDIYGMLDVADLRTKVIEPGLWFFPTTPDIDENGTPNLLPMYEAGLVRRLAVRTFDASKQYIWPIPTKEILINENLSQNPGY